MYTQLARETSVVHQKGMPTVLMEWNALLGTCYYFDKIISPATQVCMTTQKSTQSIQRRQVLNSVYLLLNTKWACGVISCSPPKSILTTTPTYSMEQSPPEANSNSDSQEMPCLHGNKGSLLCPQEPASGLHSDTNESHPQTHILFP
jgi:hypothetical protein